MKNTDVFNKGKGKYISRGVSKTVQEKCSELIYKAINADPGLRFQSCEEMFEAVNELIERLASKKHALVTQMPAPIESFQGRGKELEQISDCYSKGQRAVFLQGEGGIGKTELAIRYASENPELESHFVVFKGSMRDTIMSLEFFGYKNKDHNNKPKDEDTIYKEKLELLSQYDEACLLIIDNFNCTGQSIDEVLNEQAFIDLMGLPIRLLFTTRNDFGFNTVRVKELSNEELIGLFRHFYKSSDNTATDRVLSEIFETVAGHTMTVELIAKTLQESRGQINADNMLELMKNLENEQFKDVVSQKDRQVQGYSKKDRLYNHIKKLFDLSNLMKDEKDALINLSLLPGSGMYYSLFVELEGCKDEHILDSLIRKGWVRCDEATHILTLHPLVSEVCAKELKPTYTGKYKAFINRLTDNSFYDYKSRILILNTVKNVLKRKIDIEDKDIVHLLLHLSREFLSLDLPIHSIPYGFQALEFCEKILPADHPDLAAAYYYAGYAQALLGYHAESIKKLFKALDIRKRILPLSHPDLADTYNGIGCAYGVLGLNGKALDYYLKALDIRKKALSSDHPDLAASYNNIGWTYYALRQHGVALENYLTALNISKKSLSSSHPDLAAVYNNVGCVYAELAEHEKALEYLLKALDIRKMILPSDHPDIGTSYYNIGYVYDKLDDHDKALKYHLQALDIFKNMQPLNLAKLASSYHGVGSLYAALGEHDKAMPCFLHALRIRKKFLPLDPALRFSHNNMGFLFYNHIGAHEKFLEYTLKSLDYQKKALPPDLPYIGDLYSRAGWICKELLQPKKALKYMLKALDIYRKILPPDHEDLAELYEDTGWIFSSLGEEEKYLEYRLKAQNIREKIT